MKTYQPCVSFSLLRNAFKKNMLLRFRFEIQILYRVSNGMKMSPADRKSLRQGGDAKADLVRFLEAIEVQIKRMNA